MLATGASATENVINVQRDSQRGVTCYLLNDVGISCIPDSQLQAGNERQLSPHENRMDQHLHVPRRHGMKSDVRCEQA